MTGRATNLRQALEAGIAALDKMDCSFAYCGLPDLDAPCPVCAARIDLEAALRADDDAQTRSVGDQAVTGTPETAGAR